MSDPVLAEKAPEQIIAEVLARYEVETGVTLAPADPRRLHLNTIVYFLALQRSLIDFAGKQSLPRYASDEWIDALYELWAAPRRPAAGSTCTVRFRFTSAPPNTIHQGFQVTDENHVWAVVADTTADDIDVFALVACTVAGASTNGVAVGQIDEAVNPALEPLLDSVTNTTPTSGGRDLESLEAYRERVRDEPEASSSAGPRNAYQGKALKASPRVADAQAVAESDNLTFPWAPGPGEVVVCILEGERAADGTLTSIIPEPASDLIDIVELALSAEEERPLTDSLAVREPDFFNFDVIATYWIAESRSDFAAEIQAAVAAALDGYLLWQQSKISRDINPSELITRLVNAGAKRVAVTAPVFSVIGLGQSARLYAASLTYGGIEND